MRIKLNLTGLTPDRNSSIYWLHVDLNCIVYVKHLKEKVKKLLKESRDIDLCLDGVLFFDEDDIHVIQENEEITVIVKENIEYSELNIFNTDETDLSTKIIELNSEIDNEHSILSKLPKDSKKRVRKRTHKKKEPTLKRNEILENSNLDMMADTPIILPKETSKMHKRFKLNNDNCFHSESSNEEHKDVTNNLVGCYSSPLNFKNNNTEPVWKNVKPIKSKLAKVPVFVRGQTLTPNSLNNSSFSENENHSNTINNIMEHNDPEVVDWKDMSKINITNISELQIHDILQFKILVLNELGEAAISSSITARLEQIIDSTLVIKVLSGMKEFIVSEKFNIGNEEYVGTEREIDFQDLYELTKLI